VKYCGFSDPCERCQRKPEKLPGGMQDRSKVSGVSKLFSGTQYCLLSRLESTENRFPPEAEDFHSRKSPPGGSFSQRVFEKRKVKTVPEQSAGKGEARRRILQLSGDSLCKTHERTDLRLDK